MAQGMSARMGVSARMTRRWRRADDVPAEPALEGWISDLAGGDTSVRRLRKRLEATQDESGEVPAVVSAEGSSPAPDGEPASEMARLVG